MNQLPALFEIIADIHSAGRTSYKARESGSGRIVHLKRARNRKSAVRETRLLRRVRSPFVPEVVRLVREGDDYWLAVEWIEGTPFSAWPRDPGAWIADLARALSQIHRWGIVHGDLKPGNLLRRGDGVVCLVDFEFAAVAGDDQAFHEAGGTAGYIAPERLAGWPADPRADLYSLGCILAPYFEGNSPISDLVASLLARSPAKRPASGDQVLASIVSVMGEGRIPEPDLSFTGWRTGRIALEGLATGMRSHLGCDWHSASALAQKLLAVSGGQRSVAAAIWYSWLPRFVRDPWRPGEPKMLRSALLSLDTEARRQWGNIIDHQIDPASRRWIALAGHLGETFALRRTRLLTEVLVKHGEQLAEQAFMVADATGSSCLLRGGILSPAIVEDRSTRTTGLRFVSSQAWLEAMLRADAAIARDIHRSCAIELQSEIQAREDSSSRSLATLAWHWKEAGDGGRAQAAWFEAAELGGRSTPDHETLEYLESAIGEWAGWRERDGKRPPALLASESAHAIGRDLVIEKVRAYVSALTYNERFAEAEEWLDLLRSLAEESLEETVCDQLQIEILQRSRRGAELLGLVDGILGRIPDDDSIRGSLLLAKAQALAADPRRFAEAIEPARLAGEAFARIGEVRRQCAALSTRGAAHYRAGNLDEAADLFAESLRAADAGGIQHQAAFAHTNLTAIENRRGNREAGLDHLRTAHRISRECRLAFLEIAASLNLAHWHFLRGEWDAALEHARTGLALAHEKREYADMATRALEEIAWNQLGSGRIPLAERAAMDALGTQTPHQRKGSLRGADILIVSRLWVRGIPADEWLTQGERTAHAAMSLLLEGEDPSRVESSLDEIPDAEGGAFWKRLIRARCLSARGSAEEALSLLCAAEATVLAEGGFLEALFLDLERARLAVSIGTDTARARSLVEGVLSRAHRSRSRWFEAQALLLKALLETGSARSTP
jgi:serine/threonine protein kinase/tetratricopeptide (TPR) repeat protein